MSADAAWTCPFCALLCDGYAVARDELPPRLVGSDCPRANDALRAFDLRASNARVMAQAQVDGGAASIDAAVDAAAAALRAARQPLLAGLVTDVDGMRALYRLAAATGAILDHAHGDAMQRALSALQDRGQYAATLAEVREHAELIVCVGTQPARAMPEFWRRIGIGESGRALRRIVFLGVGADARLGAPAGVAVDPLQPLGDLHDALSRLAAAVAGRPLRATARDPAIEALAQALRAARYAVFVWEPAALDAHGAIAAEMIQRIIHTLNRTTRAAAFAIAGNDAGTTAQQVATWLSGLPLRTRVSRASLVHEPLRYRSASLLADGAIDALLWVSSFHPLPAAPAFNGGPRIVLGHPGAAASNTASGTIFIPVSTPGIGSEGHLFRADNVVALPAPRIVDDGLPTVAEIASRLGARLAS